MTANHLNQFGLLLGLISGLLLIPEVFRLIPFESLNERIDKLLSNFDAKTKFPMIFHPPSWKMFFSAEQREKYIEPITAISGLVFSVIWVGTVMFGLITASRFFMIFGFIPPLYVIFRNLIEFRNNLRETKRYNLVGLLVISLIMMLFSPAISLLRVVFLILRYFVSKMKQYFAKHMAIQNLMTTFAIIAFIISNILQLIATYIEK